MFLDVQESSPALDGQIVNDIIAVCHHYHREYIKRQWPGEYP